MLLWIKDAMSPQEIRDRIMDDKSDFQQAMVAYLESVHQGEHIDGSMESVHQRLESQEQSDPTRVCPTETLPERPPDICITHKLNFDAECAPCASYVKWQSRYQAETDDVLFKSNRHQSRHKSMAVRYVKKPGGQASTSNQQYGLQRIDRNG